MPRRPRIVLPGIPHHVTQRGNRRQQTFFCEGDYALYAHVLQEECEENGVEILAYCFMPNHSHAIAVPEREDGLRKAFGAAHRRYTSAINEREGWQQSHLWQGRFFSSPMDAEYTLNAACYIELNPVEAGLCVTPAEWPWSSARAHLLGRDDGLVRVAPLLQRVVDWGAFLRTAPPERVVEDLERASGRVLGSEAFVEFAERVTGRALLPRQAGRPPTKIREVSPDFQC